MRFFFSLPGFGDQNYRDVLNSAESDNILMSYYYLLRAEDGQLAAYVKEGRAGEKKFQECKK